MSVVVNDGLVLLHGCDFSMVVVAVCACEAPEVLDVVAPSSGIGIGVNVSVSV